MVFALASVAAIGQAGDEAPPSFTAATLLAADVRKGPHHTVQDAVTTAGFFHEFQIASDYGELEAIGLSQLTTRLNEVRALASLDEVSKSEVFLKSAGGAVVNVGKSTAKVVTDPVATAKGVGTGAKRLGVNLGRMTKRAVNSAGNESEAAEPEGNAAEGAANSVLGVSGAMRRWARKVGADPYTTNPVLLQALKDIAQIDAAGSIATKVVLPIPAIVTTSASVGDLVWGKDPGRAPEDQRGPAEGARRRPGRCATLLPEPRLHVDVADPVHRGTRRGEGQGARGLRGRGGKSVGRAHALFFVESVEMLQRAHAAAPIGAVLDDSEAMVARQGQRALMLLPLDYVPSTAQTREVMSEVSGRVKKEFAATQMEVRLTGQASARTRAELTRLGWAVKEKQPLR